MRITEEYAEEEIRKCKPEDTIGAMNEPRLEEDDIESIQGSADITKKSNLRVYQGIKI